MSGGIFLLRDGDLVAMREQAYDTEDVLQELVAKFPDLLAGDQFSDGESRRWLLVEREGGVPADLDASDRWHVDHVFLDQDAMPTLVEVKRSSDTRIRREVIGQIIDNAAHAVVNWGDGHLRAIFERRCERERSLPEEQLTTVLAPGADADEFWAAADQNLKSGKLRLVLLSDEIPKELRRVVEFLNGQMDAEVIAIEVKQYVGAGDAKTLVPRVIGQTAIAEARKGPVRRAQWTEQRFFEALAEKTGPSEVAVARRIVEWSTNHMTRLTWGRGKVDGSFIPAIDVGEIHAFPFAIYTYGRVEVQFMWLRARPFDDEQKRLELVRRLNEAPGIEIPEDAISRRPSIPLSTFARSPDALEQFLDEMGWVVSSVRAAAQTS